MSQEKNRLRSLDTLRGAAIVMVVAFHASLPFRLPPALTSLFGFGNQGVQLFFLISAFTMCLMWGERATELQRTAKFYIRRFLRIAPLYWLALAVYYGWDVASGDTPSTLYQIALNATFLHGFSPVAINSAVPGGWSIAVEMGFYAVFPLLASLSLGPERLMLFAAAAWLVLGVAVSTWLQQAYALPSIFIYYSQLTQFPIFPIGMAVYALSTRAPSATDRRVAMIAAAWLVVAFAGKYGLGLNTRPFFWLQNFAFAATVLLFVRHRLSQAVFAELGTLSYSMYLFHFLVLHLVLAFVPPTWRGSTPAFFGFLAVVLLLTALVGRLSRATLERWSATAARALVAKVGPPAAPRVTVP